MQELFFGLEIKNVTRLIDVVWFEFYQHINSRLTSVHFLIVLVGGICFNIKAFS